MKVTVTSVLVDDQAKALKFYTEVLGFQVKNDVPTGDYRWLTVVSPEAPDGVEVLLEPMAFEPAKVYQRQLFEAGIPLTSFGVDDCKTEYERLTKRGVKFRAEPQDFGPVVVAMLEDTCGNLIQIAQRK